MIFTDLSKVLRGILSSGISSKISGWMFSQLIFGNTKPLSSCNTLATHSILPEALKQCPVIPLRELICGKSFLRFNAFTQFSISTESFPVAVRWPFIRSTSEACISAFFRAPVMHRCTASLLAAVILPSPR